MFVVEVVVFVYKLGLKDKYEDVVLFFCSFIQQVFKDLELFFWFFLVDDFEVKLFDEFFLFDFLKFLNYVIFGDVDVERCEKIRCIVFFIGQVCYVFCYLFNVQYQFVKCLMFLVLYYVC